MLLMIEEAPTGLTLSFKIFQDCFAATRRLGHEHQFCIDLYLLNHQLLLPEDPLQAPFHPQIQALGPFIEQEHDDAYYEEMIHNVDLEDPDPEWSDWGSNPFGSPTSSKQNKSAISFFDGEGYQQEGFHSYSSSDSARTISEAWLVEENSNFEDTIHEPDPIPPPQPPIQNTELLQPFSPSIFLVSDIQESELISDSELRSPAIKRLNPDQQSFLKNAGIGSSSGQDSSRTVTDEDFKQWTNFYQPAKIFKHDNLEQSTSEHSISFIFCTFNTTSIEESSPQTAFIILPAATE